MTAESGTDASSSDESPAIKTSPPMPKQLAALGQAISLDRMATYLVAADNDAMLARDLYVWDRDVSLAILADIAILEVALRNAINDSMATQWGAYWYENSEVELDARSMSQLERAWQALPKSTRKDRRDPQLPGRLVARCMLGFWANLLDSGDYIGSEPRRRRIDYETLWRQVIYRAFRGGRVEARSHDARYTREWTHSVVKKVNILRNRIAHHEPLVNGFPLPGQNLRMSASAGHEECMTLARMLDRNLAGWLAGNTRVPELLKSKPRY